MPRATLLGALGVGTILAYGVFVSIPLLRGPTLSISTVHPYDGRVLIEGAAERVSHVVLNDSPIALTEEGTFSVERAYPPGYTVLVVRAEDRFGRVREETRPFITPHLNIHGTQESIEERESTTE